MKTGNFDWFLHAMFFYHKHVIQRQKQKETPYQIDVNDDDDEEEEEENNDGERRWNEKD